MVMDGQSQVFIYICFLFYVLFWTLFRFFLIHCVSWTRLMLFLEQKMARSIEGEILRDVVTMPDRNVLTVSLLIHSMKNIWKRRKSNTCPSTHTAEKWWALTEKVSTLHELRVLARNGPIWWWIVDWLHLRNLAQKASRECEIECRSQLSSSQTVPERSVY